MASIPGVRFDISGASGSQGLLSPKGGWFCYILPRGAYAAQDSTGTTITFDSASVAGRFAANNWIQVGTDTSKLRKVSSVSTNTVVVSGAAVTVSENDRVFIIGNTQPSVTGGSATYIIPQTIIRQRDDDAADIYTNSMVTTNSNGLVQFFASPAIYDAIIQDGNQSNQGSIADLAVGVVEGISTEQAVIFGGTFTVNGTMGVTGWATFGSTVTMNAALGVTGWATFGASVTITGALGVTGTGTFGTTLSAGVLSVTGSGLIGATLTVVGTSGNYSHTGTAKFGNTVTLSGAFGVTGDATFSGNVSSIQGSSDIKARRFVINRSTTVGSTYFSISGWGSTATVTVTAGSVDQAGQFFVSAGGTTYASNPTINHLARDGDWTYDSYTGAIGPQGVMIGCRTSPTLVPVAVYDSGSGDLGRTWVCGITATHGEVYQFNYIYFGTSSL